MSPTATQENNERALFFKSLKPKNVEPLWTVMSAMVPPKPLPKATPTVWSYKQLRPLLEESGRLVPAEESERRVLMLINPSLLAPQTTDTLYAGLQYINPGEVAPAHRHCAFALRFIIEGEGGYTNVEGCKMYMSKGDVILTPRWEWHDHGKDGNGPMIWLDGLDLPMFKAIPVNFAEHYESDTFPSKLVETTKKYQWRNVQEQLDIVEGTYARYDYCDQKNSDLPISTIVGAQAERISVGAESPSRQETTSFVYHVYGGIGHTVLRSDDGKEEILKWEDNDVFCIPSWKQFKHVNKGSTTAYLFNFSDIPMLKSLDLFRENKDI